MPAELTKATSTFQPTDQLIAFVAAASSIGNSPEIIALTLSSAGIATSVQEILAVMVLPEFTSKLATIRTVSAPKTTTEAIAGNMAIGALTRLNAVLHDPKTKAPTVVTAAKAILEAAKASSFRSNASDAAEIIAQAAAEDPKLLESIVDKFKSKLALGLI